MAQNFGMMASYGEPKDKTKSVTTGIAQQLKGHPAEPEVKKTTGIVVRPRETHRRRREDLGGIGHKQNKKVE
jgi:hypothetical protein